MTEIASSKITILLADDEPLSRAGIRALLAQANDIETVGEAQDGFEVRSPSQYVNFIVQNA